MEQLILHLIGDYLAQSDWMATSKSSKSFACLCHALTYTLPFLLLTQKPGVLMVISISHFLIDRFRLARYVIYAKNFIAPLSVTTVASCGKICNICGGLQINKKYSWENCKATGYPSEVPEFLAFWLLVIADNTIHLAINYLSIKYL